MVSGHNAHISLFCLIPFTHIHTFVFKSDNRDYTSAQTLRVEFGINQEMEQFDRSFKVRQMLGANK